MEELNDTVVETVDTFEPAAEIEVAASESDSGVAGLVFLGGAAAVVAIGVAKAVKPFAKKVGGKILNHFGYYKRAEAGDDEPIEVEAEIVE